MTMAYGTSLTELSSKWVHCQVLCSIYMYCLNLFFVWQFVLFCVLICITLNSIAAWVHYCCVYWEGYFIIRKVFLWCNFCVSYNFIVFVPDHKICFYTDVFGYCEGQKIMCYLILCLRNAACGNSVFSVNRAGHSNVDPRHSRRC